MSQCADPDNAGRMPEIPEDMRFDLLREDLDSLLKKSGKREYVTLTATSDIKWQEFRRLRSEFGYRYHFKSRGALPEEYQCVSQFLTLIMVMSIPLGVALWCYVSFWTGAPLGVFLWIYAEKMRIKYESSILDILLHANECHFIETLQSGKLQVCER